MQDSELASLTKQIVEIAKPLRIILFGSRARGKDSRTGDYDLLVVVKDGSRRRDIAQTLYKSIRNIRTPFDLVVATERDLKEHADNPHFIYKNAVDEGTEIYEA